VRFAGLVRRPYDAVCPYSIQYVPARPNVLTLPETVADEVEICVTGPVRAVGGPSV